MCYTFEFDSKPVTESANSMASELLFENELTNDASAAISHVPSKI